LKKTQESKDKLLEKQRDLEKEMKSIQSQIKKEEQDTKILEQQTKTEENKKAALMEIHKQRMREIRRKIMASITNQNISNQQAQEEKFKQGKLQIELQAARDDSEFLKNQLATDIDIKQRTKETKRKLEEQIEKEKQELDKEKDKTNALRKTAADTKRTEKRTRHNVQDSELDIKLGSLDNQVLEKQQENVSVEADLLASQNREAKRQIMDLEINNKQLQDEMRDSLDDREKKNERGE